MTCGFDVSYATCPHLSAAPRGQVENLDRQGTCPQRSRTGFDTDDTCPLTCMTQGFSVYDTSTKRESVMTREWTPEWADRSCQVCTGSGLVRGAYSNLPAEWTDEDAETCESCWTATRRARESA